MRFGAWFNKEVVTALPSDSLLKVGQLMERDNVGAVVVAEEGRPVGIVTDRDLALALCVRGATPDDTVQSVMTCPVTTLAQGDGVFTAAETMMTQAVRRLPVVDNSGRLVGLVSLDDLLVLLSKEFRLIADGVRAETGVR